MLVTVNTAPTDRVPSTPKSSLAPPTPTFTGCYVIRAVLEERFLAAQDPAYAEYMRRTRWRFVPGVF